MSLRIVTLTFFLGGCSMFQPVKDSAVRHLLEPLAPLRTLTASTPAIAVNRAALPGYLDGQALVIRRDGALVASNHELWAEPLDASISRVMAENLSRLTGSMKIQPVENFSHLDYTGLLELRISRFDPDLPNRILLQGNWKLQPVTGKQARDHFFHITLPFKQAPDGVGGRVVAMNQALEKLAREIVAKEKF
jgi:uncharacterized lipoprotein YmbA